MANSEETTASLDIIDEYQQDADSVSETELTDKFSLRYQQGKKVSLTGGFQISNTFIHLVSNKDNSILAAANKKGNVSLVDVKSGIKTSSFEAHSQEVTGLRFCPLNPNLLYSCSLDCTIKLRDLRTNDFQHTFEHKDEEGNGKEFTCLDVNCAGEFLCSGTSLTRDEDAYLVFWDIKKNKMLGGYSESHSNDITCVRFHPNKRQTLLSGAMDNLINFYDVSKKSESDAFSNCINLETTPDAVHWDPHTDYNTKLFAANYPQTVQYWDIEDTKPTANLTAKKLCKAMKRLRPDQCHYISLNFDKDLLPLLTVSSNLSCDTQNDACVRTLFYDREKNKLKPHSVLEIAGNNTEVLDSLYLASQDLFITLDTGSLRYWSPKGQKRDSNNAFQQKDSKKRKQ